ncbi:cupin domain-containing protein [candidate division KSB1 bacterium]|nr:cupin domain-containing protein [candidate division KSB1 bacterium]
MNAIWPPKFFLKDGDSPSCETKHRKTLVNYHGSDIYFTIENCVNHFDIENSVKTKVGYQYWFIDKNFLDGRTLKLSVVEPHSATHAPHRHAEDEIFFVLEGTAEFSLDGEKAIGGPYTSFYCPANRSHGIRNAGDNVLKYLVIKKYPRAQIKRNDDAVEVKVRPDD